MDLKLKKCVFPSLLTLGLVIAWLMCLPKCEGTTGAQCAQFGVNDAHDFDLRWLENSTWKDGNHHPRQGYWTIGARPFDARYITFLGSTFDWYWNVTTGSYHSIANYTANDSVCPWPWVICPNKSFTGDTACAWWWYETEFCIPNNLTQIRMYLVKQNGRVLKGWLHIEVELMVQDDDIRLIYVQMRDEHFNAIGEFVGANEATCKPSKDYLVRPTKFQLYPCSAVGFREPKNSHGIFMAEEYLYIDPTLKDKDGWIPKKSISRGVHFLWKMDEYYCNRHQRLQPFAYIWTRKSEEAVIKSKDHAKKHTKLDAPSGATYALDDRTLGAGMGYAKTWRKIPNNWIYPQWYGATDIVFADGELDCSELAVDDDKGEVSKNGLSWLQSKVTRVKWVEDNWFPENRYQTAGFRGSYGCQAESLSGNQNYKTVPVFSGRCATLKEKKVGMDTLHSCTFDPSVLADSFEGVNQSLIFGNVTYSKYKNLTVERRLVSCSFPCRGPTTPQDLEAILKYPTLNISKNETGPNTTKGGIPLEEKPYGTNLRYVAREENALLAYKYHGILAVIITFFITPVSTILARHYKETFMNKRCFGMHVWYWVHGTGIMTSFALFSSGHATLNPYTSSWGSSIHEYGKLHRITAYVIWTIFALMLTLGGFRPRCIGFIRKACSTFHSVFGYTYQWLNFFAVIISTGIPFSPSAGHCSEDDNFPVLGTGSLLYLTIGVIFINVAFDVGLLVFQCVIDGQEEVKRGWWCPIVPILPTDHLRDYRGAGIRKIVLLIFLAVSAGATVAASYIIAFNSVYQCKLGPTTCPSEFGCSHLAKKYGEFVVAQCGSFCSK